MRQSNTSEKYKYILGIDTSCDETSAAIVRGTTVLSNIVSSQIELHRKYGGVVPMIAKREHQERIDPVITEAIKVANRYSDEKINWDNIAAIAVTYGPGLAIALEVGLAKARELCQKYDKPLIAVNHMEGHLWSAIAANSKGKGGIEPEDVKFPVLGVLISGGHTELIKATAFGKYEMIGETLDDAMGEAFDKVARMIGLGYPGGAVLSEMAKQGNPMAYKLPIPLKNDGTCNFSYSGLKTAVFYLVKELKKDHEELKKQEILDIAASFESSAIEELCIKVRSALKREQFEMVVVGGGVTASVKVRAALRTLCQKFGLQAHFPSTNRTNMDNGAMIAIAGYLKALRGEFSEISIDREPRASLVG